MTSFQSRSPHFPLSLCIWLLAGGMAETILLAALGVLLLAALTGTALSK